MPKLSFEPSTITVWTGEFGKYVVPTRLEGVAMASGGLTDHPFKHPMQEEFYAWVKEQDEWARLELASLASLTSKPDTTFVSALVQELITTVLEMHRAEDAYGSGFYNDDGWSSAYHKAFDLAAALSKTDTSGAKNG